MESANLRYLAVAEIARMLLSMGERLAILSRGYARERAVEGALVSGSCTWHELAREIARLLNRESAKLIPVSVADVALRAHRPKFAALSNAKLAAAGITMPSWQNALSRYLSGRLA